MTNPKKGKGTQPQPTKRAKKREAKKGKAVTLNFDLRCRVTTDLLDEMLQVISHEGGAGSTLFGAMNIVRAYVETVRTSGDTSVDPDDEPISL